MKKNCSLNKNGIILNLNEGLEIEYRALDMYRDLLTRLNDKVDKNMVEMIIDDEKKHIKLVENLIEIVNQYLK